MNTTIIATLLALAPSTSPPAEFDVSDIELEVGDRSAHLLAFDADGEVSAELITWVDDDDRPRIDAVFADGLYVAACTCLPLLVEEWEDTP